MHPELLVAWILFSRKTKMDVFPVWAKDLTLPGDIFNLLPDEFNIHTSYSDTGLILRSQLQ